MKRNIAIIITICIGMIFIYGCKEKKAEEKSGIVTFKLGSVKIKQADQQPMELQIKDAVRAGDAITTGDKSAVIVQFAENCVVRVDENSTFKVLSSSENNRDLFVQQGQVLTKLIRTGNNNATIKTPTAVAGVRGTQFSVNYNEGKTRIAVTEGKVAVSAARTDDTGKTLTQTKEETLTEAGKTAEVAKQEKTPAGEDAPLALNVRPISDGEKRVLKKIEVVPVIQEVEKKNPNELETTIKEVIKKEKESEAQDKQERLKALMEKKTRSMDEIREVFSRIDEITLYSGRIVQGAIISRGANYTILTPNGTISIPEKEIKGSRILR